MRVRSSRSAQRGATLLMTVGFMLLALSSLALVLDTGRLYLEKRRLQRVVDVAALDAANRGVLCGPTDTESVRQIAQASATRNGYTGTVTTNQVEFGKLAVVSGARVFSANSADPDAVRLTLNKSVPASFFGGGLTGQSITLQATAVGERSLLAGITAGSNLLALNSSASPLLGPVTKALFGKSANLGLSALSYSGIANAGVTLRDLLGVSGLNILTSDLTVGGINSALATNVTLASLINTSIAVLGNKGVVNAQLNTLQTGIKSANVRLSDFLQVSASDALDTQVNVLDFIMAGAYAGNKGSALALDLSTSGLAISGLTNLGLSMKVIEPPQVAYGKAGESSPGVPRTVVKTAQLKLVASAKVTVPLLANLQLGVAVNAADGRVWLKEAQCQTLGNPYRVTLNGTTSTLTTAIGNPTYLTGNDTWKDQTDSSLAATMQTNSANIDILPVLTVPTVRVKIYGVVPRGTGASRDVLISVSDRTTDLPTNPAVSISSGLPGLSSSLGGSQLGIDLALLGIPLLPAGLLTNVTSTVLPLVNGLLGTLLTPALDLLGINLNSVDTSLTTIDDSGVRISY